jgi:hypothetical protein
MPRGSRPGERRGGRKKGTPNKPKIVPSNPSRATGCFIDLFSNRPLSAYERQFLSGHERGDHIRQKRSEKKLSRPGRRHSERLAAIGIDASLLSEDTRSALKLR